MQFKPIQFLTISGILAVWLLFAACTTVKNYQPYKPFVYNNTIELNGNISKDEKKRLTADLTNYWDDSLKVPKLRNKIFFYKINKPPLFDSVNIIRSQKFMNAYLNSQGFYYATFKDSIPKFDTLNDQVRVNVFMTINVGKNITIDSVSYAIVDTLRKPIDSTLQKLVAKNTKNAYIKQGEPYTKQAIDRELDRVVGLLRDSGYFKISREDVYALVDTTNNNLLKLTFDPIEQAKLVEEAAKTRKENPKWDIEIRQKHFTDTTKSNKYFINKIYYYPEATLTDQIDSLIKRKDFKELNSNEFTMRYKEGKFIINPLKSHTYFNKNDVYSETKYYKTVNTLSQIGAWQQVDAKIIADKKDSLSLYLALVPALKQSYSVNLEGSRNTGDLGSGNLLGIATTVTYQNRNIWKRAIQSITSLRLGTELNVGNNTNASTTPLLQTLQANISHAYSFPRLIIPKFKSTYFDNAENKRTVFNIATSYTDRRTYYKLQSITTNFAYEWSKKGLNWSFKPLNVELYRIDTLSGLIDLLNSNPFLKNSFRNGNVLGSAVSVFKTFNSRKDPNQSHYIRFGAEESGTVASLLGKLSDQIFTYVKLEGEYKYAHHYRKHDIASRFFIGAALPKAGQTIPIFKEYFLGGPNSMRAWSLRSLGLGSSKVIDQLADTLYKERFGNFALEANVEYRFSLLNVSSFKVGSALYADVGNIWSLQKDPANPDAEFSFSRLGKDIAVGIGTGLRFDFSYFLIRLDFAYKLKDPAREYSNGWSDFSKLSFAESRSNGISVKNYAIQFGIGLPF